MLSQQYRDAERHLPPGTQYESQVLNERNSQQKYVDQHGSQFQENSGKFKRSTPSHQGRQPVHEDFSLEAGAEIREKPTSKMNKVMYQSCAILSQKNRELESKYNEERRRNDSLHNMILQNRALNTVPDSDHIKKIGALQQRLQERQQEISACRTEITNLKKDISAWKAEARSKEEDKIAVEEVLANSHKRIEELQSNKSLTSPETVRRIIAEIEQMRVNETERNIELKTTKRRFFNLLNEWSIEKQKNGNIKGELEAQQLNVKELNQKLCDLSFYARTQIYNLGSELAKCKHQKLEDTIGDLPKLLEPSKETQMLQREVSDLRKKVKFQKDHLNMQKQSYDSLVKQYDKLQAAFKHPHLVSLVSKYREELKYKGHEITRLRNDLGLTKLENKSLRKQVDTLTSSERLCSSKNANERGISAASARVIVTNPSQSNCDSVRLDTPSSCKNNGAFFFSLDHSPASCLDARGTRIPNEFESGNNNAFAVCFTSSPSESISSEGTYASSG